MEIQIQIGCRDLIFKAESLTFTISIGSQIIYTWQNFTFVYKNISKWIWKFEFWNRATKENNSRFVFISGIENGLDVL